MKCCIRRKNRLREKTFLQQAGLPVTRFQAIHSAADLQAALQDQAPGVLKTASWGYDGKGQTLVDGPAMAESAWQTLGTDAAVLEQFVDFSCELSVVAARGADGQFAYFEPIQNTHRNHILDMSVTPCQLPAQVADEAVEIARQVFEALQVVGVLCVEFFLTRDDQLLINELAPRPHNSGHLTIDAHVTCQFEQQVRAVCGLPLGSTRRLQAAAMVNLLGDCWQPREPAWAEALQLPDVKLHLYGKVQPRPGRKMGHLTALAPSAEAAIELAQTARQRL